MNNLIKIVFLVLLNFITNTFTLYSENTWDLISINEYPFFSSVKFFDIQNGIALSPYAIYKTTDGGYKWVSIVESTDPAKMFINLKIKDSVTYLLRSDGVILKSNLDFSKDTLINIDIKNYYNKLVILDHQKIVLLSVTKKIIVTSNDGGESWSISDIQYFSSSKYLLDIIFINNETGFVCSDDGKIYKTTNFGKSWDIILDIGTFIQKLFYKDENNIWFGTVDGKLYYTTDGGNSWSNSIILENIPISSMYFINNQEGYVSLVSNSSGILYSTKDGCKSWSLDYSFDQKSTEIQDIFFLDNLIGWCVGNSGLILKLTKGNDINIHKNYNNIFPNPARSTTSISLQQEGEISITAVDVLGRSFPLWSDFTTAGDMELDVSLLPTGTYTLLINYGTKVESVRLIKE